MAKLKMKTVSLLVLGVVLAVAAGIYAWQLSRPVQIPEHLLSTGGDFTLHSADGPVGLRDLRGKVVLIYFGYTHCPDACPMTMSNWAAAFKRLNETERARVRGLLVSIDPERDTLESLKRYTAYFHPNIIGVSGSHDELRQVVSLYRSDYVREPEQTEENYEVAHMSFVYVVDPEGKVRDLLIHESAPGDIIKSVRNALSVGD